MLLVAIQFKHYAPKDSEEGIKEYVICNDINDVAGYMDSTWLSGRLKDWENDGDEDEFSPCLEDEDYEKWIAENKDKLEKLGLELEVSEYDGKIFGVTASGPKHLLVKFCKGTYFEEVSDAYYGVTQWDWINFKEITEDQKQVLVATGVAKVI